MKILCSMRSLPTSWTSLATTIASSLTGLRSFQKNGSTKATTGTSSTRSSRSHGKSLRNRSRPSKKSLKHNRLKALAESQLMPILNDMLAYNKQNHRLVISANEVLANFYAFGLLSDLTRKLKTYRDENNVMLLADASKFLNGVI